MLVTWAALTFFMDKANYASGTQVFAAICIWGIVGAQPFGRGQLRFSNTIVGFFSRRWAPYASEIQLFGAL